MDRKLDIELNLLKDKLLEMSGIVQEMVTNSINALIFIDESLLGEIDDNEKKVNRLQIDIDEFCLRIMALFQPTASDLRFLLGVAKINAELERVGDHAVNISRRVTDIIKSPPIKPFVDLPLMTDITASMFRESMTAFIESDVDMAKLTLLRDDEVDRLKYKKINDLKEIMKKNPSTIDIALELIIIVNNLEKIADHATNIAEVVIFVAQGKDVRHHFAE
jgi:phosphate transport system protein